MVLMQSFHHLVTVASLVIHKFSWPLSGFLLAANYFLATLEYFSPIFQPSSHMVVDTTFMVRTPRFTCPKLSDLSTLLSYLLAISNLTCFKQNSQFSFLSQDQEMTAQLLRPRSGPLLCLILYPV